MHRLPGARRGPASLSAPSPTTGFPTFAGRTGAGLMCDHASSPRRTPGPSVVRADLPSTPIPSATPLTRPRPTMKLRPALALLALAAAPAAAQPAAGPGPDLWLAELRLADGV